LLASGVCPVRRAEEEVSMHRRLLALVLALAAGIGTVLGGRLAPLPAAAAAGIPSTLASLSGTEIVQTALKYEGYRYRPNGRTPQSGFDPIGFVSFVYRVNGVPLPHTLRRALAFAPQVPESDLQPGDVLYFKNTIRKGLSHAAIYIGDGRFVHAEWYNRGVTVSSLSDDPTDGSYWETHYLTANRPLAK
jgi:cell wall-associated NlpC family hydrolase